MSFAGLKKQVNKANQFMSEKIGGAKGTALDEEFVEMEREQVVRGYGRGRSKSRRGANKRGRSSDRGGRSRSTSRGRGSGSRRPITAITQSEKERLHERRRQRQIELRELVEKCTEERLRKLVADVIDREPGLLFDLLVDNGPDEPEPVPGPAQQLPWCKCGNCREMATERERLCCGCRPEHCMSRREEVERLVLDPQMLMVHQNYRDELLGRRGQQIEDYNRTMRHAAYRTWVLVRFGRLGTGNRVVIPSCIVWKIRDTFPSPNNLYTGFIPSRYV